MKNADAAAMPTQSNGGDIFGGLTKREMMAMHIAAGFASDGNVRPSSIPSLTIEVTDALLAELERTCHKT